MQDVLGSALVDSQVVSLDRLAELHGRAVADGIPLDRVVVSEGVASRTQILAMLENRFFCTSVDLEELDIGPECLALLPRALAKRHGVLPIGVEERTVRVATANPDDRRTLEAVGGIVQRDVQPVVVLASDLERKIRLVYDEFEKQTSVSEPPSNRPSPASAVDAASMQRRAHARLKLYTDPNKTVEFVEEILHKAIRNSVSDVHLQPSEEGLLVRFRRDGVLHTVAALDAECGLPIVSRIKVLGSMDIAEKRLPQDGRHSFEWRDELVDLRISILPSQFGEKAVIRLLTKSMGLLSLDALDPPPSVRDQLEDSVASPQGMYLVTGPTGSGKTTTLYALLAATDRELCNVITLEDPIEYSLPLLTQVQINDEIGLTFASGLRTILRQDPDVVLVGEIRDLATVEIAARASLTGHKVYSTLHTNDACQAITRLLDMGTPPYLIAATLRGVLAQRLVRRICDKCTEAYVPTEAERAVLNHARVEQLHRGRGCGTCGGTGYRGRFAIYEYLSVDESLHRLILERASPFALRHAARATGMLTMEDFARRAVLAGHTTVAEIQRVVLSDIEDEQVCGGCQRVLSADFAVCPFCQHLLREACRECGGILDSSWEACPSCGHEIERAAEDFCGKCMAPVEANWERCHYCGTGLG